MKFKNFIKLAAGLGLVYLGGVGTGIVKTMKSTDKVLEDKDLEVKSVIWTPLKGKVEVNISDLNKPEEEKTEES